MMNDTGFPFEQLLAQCLHTMNSIIETRQISVSTLAHSDCTFAVDLNWANQPIFRFSFQPSNNRLTDGYLYCAVNITSAICYYGKTVQFLLDIFQT